jgi:hypothetical protein
VEVPRAVRLDEYRKLCDWLHCIYARLLGEMDRKTCMSSPEDGDGETFEVERIVDYKKVNV